jgi:hypothetical protein
MPQSNSRSAALMLIGARSTAGARRAAAICALSTARCSGLV